MSKVIAALDTSLAAQPVLLTTQALGRALGADVEAVHVPVDGGRIPHDIAAAADVPLRVAQGPVVEALIATAREDDVVALVVGARGSPLRPKPLGSTALAVASSVDKLILVVPPEARRPSQLQRVLVPLGEGGTHAPRGIIELAEGTELDFVVLQAVGEESLPLFTDQPQHEHAAWAHEHLRRYCPWGIDSVQFEVRVGRLDELVPALAEEVDVDVIALGWAHELALDRTPVVLAALDRAHVPVLLVPVDPAAGTSADPRTKEGAWSNLQSSPA